MKLEVALQFVWQEAQPRRGEPVTVGLPWPRGAITDDRFFHLQGDDRELPLQTRVTDRWSDGSIRWCLFDFVVDRDFSPPNYRIFVDGIARPVETPEPMPQQLRTLEFGPLRLNVDETQLVIEHGGTSYSVIFQAVLAEPESLAVWDFTAHQVEEGPIRSRVRISGPLLGVGPWNGKLELSCDLDFYANTPAVRARVCIRNTQAADHPGGNWDLGNAGSVYFQELSLAVETHFRHQPQAYYSAEPGEAMQLVAGELELTQHSSGGDNWASDSQLSRKRQKPSIRGYTVKKAGAVAQVGMRATPIVQLGQAEHSISCTMPEFWQNFPKQLNTTEKSVKLWLFPSVADDPIELQGGEQKTHTLYLSFGKDEVTTEPLHWAREPVLAHAAPEWYAATGVIPHLVPENADPNQRYRHLVNLAIDGEDTFLQKREKIDEYGWRNFGDIYGDHEAVYWTGPQPMVSHYNNQYDCVAGFLYQFFRSSNPTWYQQAMQCAEHTIDIDQYHTHGDKAAYNHGLFWHTYHYAPADTGNHRSYPKALRGGGHFDTGQDLQKMGQTGESLKKAYAVGGGPASSHNYNHGLMLAYYLTGESSYREAAFELAQFVIDMDNPMKTPFRWLSRQYTGLATESGGGGYHGPGRASANSLNALMVAYRCTGHVCYLEKAEQIIRRVVHPQQNLEQLDLLNAELRWFYTMFLQALGQYLDDKIERDQLDGMYDYAQRSLLHYARWMLQHERPILDQTERLQYPTETWAAQDLRKVEVFQYAAKHVGGAERQQFLDKADWFFRYVETKLSEFPTKSLCRPVVLLLNFGWSRAWWQTQTVPVAPPPKQPLDLKKLRPWRMFVPQKVIAIRRAKRLILVAAILGLLSVVGPLAWLLFR